LFWLVGAIWDDDVDNWSDVMTNERADFESTVIPCASREAAEREAQRRQADDQGDATWIYLRIDGQWAAKRTPTNLVAVEPPRGRIDRIATVILDLFLPKTPTP
jgi:hypothetical protein